MRRLIVIGLLAALVTGAVGATGAPAAKKGTSSLST